MDPRSDRTAILEEFENSAEKLVAHQLDLLAQLEAQLRGVRNMMRHMERLRSPNRRVGAEPSNGERGDGLAHLSHDLTVLDVELATQQQSVDAMHQLVGGMLTCLYQLKRAAEQWESRARESAQDQSTGASE